MRAIEDQSAPIPEEITGELGGIIKWKNVMLVAPFFVQPTLLLKISASSRQALPEKENAPLAVSRPYLLSLEAVRNEWVRPRRESVKISHFDGSKLYQRGPLR